MTTNDSAGETSSTAASGFSTAGVSAPGARTPGARTPGAPVDDGVLLVISTFESREQAEPVARALVGERLAACANLLPGCLSIYRWQGEIERADEVLMLVKTTCDRYPELERRLHELHPYDLPEIVALAPPRVLAAYADWVAGETRQVEGDSDPPVSDVARTSRSA